MRIVFLDASTLDRGDIDFSPLEAEGSIELHPTTLPEQAAERCKGADVVITNKVPITHDLLEANPGVRLIAAAATGINHVDLEACKQRGVAVCNVAGYSTESVAQHCFALFLELTTHAASYASAIREDWPRSPIFTRLDHPVTELSGRTLGIVGLGTIGRAVARIADAFGMKVIAYARPGSRITDEDLRLPEDEFFAQADIVSLHCPLTPETSHFINKERLAKMKPGALLINTGRGPLIDEEALAAALVEGSIGGAGLDVLSVEPPPSSHPLLAAGIPNLLITPHTAWSSLEARTRLLEGLAANIRSFKDGGRHNRLD